jgi:hypothetical protein
MLTQHQPQQREQQQQLAPGLRAVELAGLAAAAAAVQLLGLAAAAAAAAVAVVG